jgi:RHS repeat-associated protein
MKWLVILLVLVLLPSISAKEVSIPELFEIDKQISILDVSEKEVYYYAGSKLIAVNDEYQYQDRLGSDFDSKSLPFGQEITSETRFSFTGKELDQDLHYFNARYYDSSLGKFTSVDPVESEPPYTYVSNNPMNFVDPNGKAGIPQFSEPQIESINFNFEQSENTIESIKNGLPGGPIIFEGWNDPNLVNFRLPENGIFRYQMENLKDVGPDQYNELVSRLGVKADRDPRRSNQYIKQYFENVGAKFYADDENDWCAACLSDTLRATGRFHPVGLTAIRALNFAAKGSSPPSLPYGAGIVSGDEEVGDIMVFNSHVGLFAGRFSNGDILLLGGNQDRKVSFKREDRAIVDIRRPLNIEQQMIYLNIASKVASLF